MVFVSSGWNRTRSFLYAQCAHNVTMGNRQWQDQNKYTIKIKSNRRENEMKTERHWAWPKMANPHICSEIFSDIVWLFVMYCCPNVHAMRSFDSSRFVFEMTNYGMHCPSMEWIITMRRSGECASMCKVHKIPNRWRKDISHISVCFVLRSDHNLKCNPRCRMKSTMRWYMPPLIVSDIDGYRVVASAHTRTWNKQSRRRIENHLIEKRAQEKNIISNFKMCVAECRLRLHTLNAL